jgi:cytochrome bd-type quinol oxidase subunit 2
MIASIVTTTTVSTVTVYTLAGSLALIGILAMAALLISKDVTATATSERAQRINRALNIALIPLMIVFGIVVIAKVMEIIG